MTIHDTPVELRSDTDEQGRLGPVAGLLFIASVVVSTILFGEIGAEPSDPASEVVADYLDPEQDIMTAAFIAMLGIGPLLVFLPIQRDRMRTRGATWEADTLVLGFAFLALATMVDTGIDLMGRVGAEHGHEAVAQAANDFTWNVVWLYSPGLLAIGLAATSAGLRHRGLPRWLGAFGAVVAVGAVMPWIGLFVGLVWMLALSIYELVQRRSGSRSA
jgi:hypothetical protein